MAAPASHTHTCSTPQSGVETVPPKPTGPSACVAPGTHVHRSNQSHEKPKPHPQVGRLRGDRVLGQGTHSVPSLDMHVIPQVHLSPRSPCCSPEETDLVTTAQDPRRGERECDGTGTVGSTCHLNTAGPPPNQKHHQAAPLSDFEGQHSRPCSRPHPGTWRVHWQVPTAPLPHAQTSGSNTELEKINKYSLLLRSLIFCPSQHPFAPPR